MIINKDEVTLGSDIEVFLQERETGKLISSIGLIPGTKDRPHYIGKEGYAVETDNVSTEFLVPIFTTSKELKKHVHHMKGVITSMVSGHLEISDKASGIFTKDQLKPAEAKRFGCDPDFNAWEDGVENAKPCIPNKRLRSNGMHIHIGYNNPMTSTSIELVKALDLILGLQSIFIDPDTERRQLYGKAGSFREKPYGVEYRVLSNYFIMHDDLMDFVVDGVYEAIDRINNMELVTDENIPIAIDNGDKDLAIKILDAHKVETRVELITV